MYDNDGLLCLCCVSKLGLTKEINISTLAAVRRRVKITNEWFLNNQRTLANCAACRADLLHLLLLNENESLLLIHDCKLLKCSSYRYDLPRESVVQAFGKDWRVLTWPWKREIFRIRWYSRLIRQRPVATVPPSSAVGTARWDPSSKTRSRGVE